jgi:predicted DNA-binding transcriptional regulator AlpA
MNSTATEQAPAHLSVPANTAPPPSQEWRRFIRQLTLFQMIDVSAATGHRMRAAGKIGPRPVNLNGSCLRYDLREVSAWLEHRRSDGTLHDSKTWPAVWASLQKSRRN